ncbi:MAG: MATE family efflux transporter [Odoribacteraceae bacterium]|jgi:MATE family multidrug resistance protein|nr:MATE family efflux transporter [Odoribacteraceae bacterium]
MNREILRLAIPSIISNLTIPLLGLVDLAIVGHLGSPAYIGAIAVGGLLFNLVYWNFGFLRLGASGLTAQARGRGDHRETTRVLARSLGLAGLSSLLVLLLQHPLARLVIPLLDASGETARHAARYFTICIWGAPAVLGLYCFKGWFIGMQNSRYPMYIALVVNLVNIAVSLALVHWFGMKIEGVATGTLVAQYAGLLLAIFLCRRRYPLPGGWSAARESFRGREIRRFLALERDIFLRSACLIAVTAAFTAAGARQGDTILAVNTLLMQLFTLFSYIMDGFAHAAEALVGRHVGACQRRQTRRVIRALFGWGVALALLFTLLYAVAGRGLLALLTDDAGITRVADRYYYWVLAIPLAGFPAFLWDGILVGATAGRQMLISMFASAVAFFAILHAIPVASHNHLLWLAFITYLLLRGILQTILAYRDREAIFGRPGDAAMPVT